MILKFIQTEPLFKYLNFKIETILTIYDALFATNL